ncbi:hypothetical protein KC640_01940 [Candidatus Dojkabacteria bacterium]|uniref:Uncharacterized protein n=1 Tax=Candidatus Dojkabacteria bacterium TaxID=2099670 RepID=A0A955I4Z5_9BACT|nr:hypothetical protein [Candidatus Dojkabacteria bacterium]
MEIFGRQTKQIGFAKVMNRQLVFILALLLVAFVAAQFVVLATVGSKGAEITGIRLEMDDLRISNEYLRSEIDKAKTLAEIEPEISEVFDIYPTSVQKVVAPSAQIPSDVVSYNP